MDIDRLTDNITRREKIINDLNDFSLQLSRFTLYINEVDFEDIRIRYNKMRKKISESIDEQLVEIKKDKTNVLRLAGNVAVSDVVENPEAVAVKSEIEREIELEEANKILKRSKGTGAEIAARIKVNQAEQNLRRAQEKTKAAKKQTFSPFISGPFTTAPKKNGSNISPPVASLPCPRIPGLKNYTNTCFANSVIWPFVALEWDSNFYGIDDKPGYKNGPFLNLMYAFKKGSLDDVLNYHRIFVTENIRDEKKSPFKGTNQEDARELIDWIINLDENKDWFNKLDIESEKELKCSVPLYQKIVRYPVNKYIILNIINSPENSTFDDLFNSYTIVENTDTDWEIDKSNGIICPKENTTQQLIFTKFSSAVIVSLSRFDNSNKKVSKSIDIPPVYKFGKYLKPKDDTDYQLVGFITHIGGTSGSGHYVATIKINGEWIHYNDDNTPIKQADTVALSEAKKAYIFFYKKTNTTTLSSPLKIRKKISPTSKILKARKKKKQIVSKLKKNK